MEPVVIFFLLGVAGVIAEHVRSVYSDNYAMVLYMTDVSVLRVEKF